MNKRFFTLMAAVMLAGAPLCNEAFAAAIPISAECIVLIVTKVDNPEELDDKFSKYNNKITWKL